jgi:cell surface protein SprA
VYTGSPPLNYITEAKNSAGIAVPFVKSFSWKIKSQKHLLLKVFNLDKLNYNNDPQAVWRWFDFLNGNTFWMHKAAVLYFTKKEPLRIIIFEVKRQNNPVDVSVYNDPSTYNENQKKYVFRSMYRSTQSGVARQK